MTEPSGSPDAPAPARGLLTLAVFAATFATHAAATLRAGAFDDAFITYTFARNVAAGLGFVWSPGEAPTYGSSTIPYALLLAAVHRLGGSIPAASLLIGCAGWAGANALLFRLFQPWGTRAALAAALLNALSLRAVQASLGMETGLYVLLVCAAFHAYATERLHLAGLLAGVVTAFRLDGALVPLLLVGHASLVGRDGSRGRLRRALRVAGPALLILLPAAVAAQACLGSVLPNALLAKTRGFALAPPFGPSTLLGALHGPGPGHDVFVPALLLLLGLGGLLLGAAGCRAPERLLFLWGVVYLLVFTASRIPESPWYAAALLPVLYQGAVEATRTAAGALRRRFGRPALARIAWLPIAAALAAAALATVQAVRADPLGTLSGGTAEHRLLAETVLDDMRARSLPQASVLAFEVGSLGYLVPGRVYDVMGLVSPEVVARGPDAGPQELLLRHHPDYAVVADKRLSPPLSALVESRAFREEYAVIASQPTGQQADYQVLRRMPGRWRVAWTSAAAALTVHPGAEARLSVPDLRQDDALVCLDTESAGSGPVRTVLDLGAGDDPATRFPFWIPAGAHAVCRPGGISGRLRAMAIELPEGREPLTVSRFTALEARDDPSPAGRFLTCLELAGFTVAGPASPELGLGHLAVEAGTVSAHPPSGFVLRIRNAHRPVAVRFTAALAPDTPAMRTDGVTFTVSNSSKTLFVRHVRASSQYDEVGVAIPGAEGEDAVTLAFTTTAGPAGNTDFDWAEWRHLAIEVDGRSHPMPEACPVP